MLRGVAEPIKKSHAAQYRTESPPLIRVGEADTRPDYPWYRLLKRLFWGLVLMTSPMGGSGCRCLPIAVLVVVVLGLFGALTGSCSSRSGCAAKAYQDNADKNYYGIGSEIGICV